MFMNAALHLPFKYVLFNNKWKDEWVLEDLCPFKRLFEGEKELIE